MPKATESAIPVGTQFSPKLIDLHEFLKAIIAHSGDKPAMEQAVWKAPVRIAQVQSAPTKRRASLPLEAARQYDLLDEKYAATPLAVTLSKLSESDLYEAFARHIMQNLGGLRVVEGAQQMALDEPSTGVAITGDTLAEYLTSQGFRVTVHNTQINTMRLWLAKVGVFSARGWDVDPAAKARVIGLSDDEIAALVGLDEKERAFAIALCRLDPKGIILASRVRELAEQILTKNLPRSSLPNLVRPLEEAGFVRVTTRGTKGGKSAELEVTDRFRKEVLEPFLERTVKDMDAVVTAYYKDDIKSVLANLDSKKPDVKGRALEAYAVQVMRILGLRFLKWRLRAKETGNAEVDVVMAGLIGAVPTRWQVQCKNTPRVATPVEDVAKEVGLAPLTKATHILFISRGGFTKDALTYANEVMRQSALTLYLLDAKDFESIRETRAASLPSILRAKAEITSRLPRAGLDALG